VRDQISLHAGMTTTRTPFQARWLNTVLLAVLLLPLLSGPVRAEGSKFELAYRLNPNQGAVAAASWLDAEHYLVLSVSPHSAQVFRHSYSETIQETFMSAGFIQQHVCSERMLGRLSWEVSPASNYLFFKWLDENDNRRWVLVDISAAPNFKLKRFGAPPGMQIADILFSPDDRFAVLKHDADHGDCDVSLLVIDLVNGREHWRLSTENLNFISELWWGGGILDAPRFNAATRLFNGQFEPHSGLARINIDSQLVEFSVGANDLICGSEAIWGHITCKASSTGSTPYILEADIPGEDAPRQIPLSAHPVEVLAMPQPGYVLLANTSDWVTNQLWLIDVFSGEKHLIDQDCAGFSLSPDGKLLVRALTRIELRVYEPVA